MDIQEKEEEATAVTTAAPPVLTKSRVRDVVARNDTTSLTSSDSETDSEPSEPIVRKCSRVNKGQPPDTIAGHRNLFS